MNSHRLAVLASRHSWKRCVALRRTLPSISTAASMRFLTSSSSSDSNNDNDNKNSDNLNIPRDYSNTVMPGVTSQHQYGSLGETLPLSSTAVQNKKAWQAALNTDVQRVTQKAMIYELIHEQTRTIEDVIPWFLENMPETYFQQVPERYRMDHIKAIAAVKDANMDLYLNLKSHTPDGRTVLTFIRPGTQAGTLLNMVQELPWKYNLETPLSRLHVFSTADETMSLNMFVYGQRRPEASTATAATATTAATDTNERELLYQLAQPILEYAQGVQAGSIVDPQLDANDPLLQHESLLEYLGHCRPTYVQIGATNPSRFLVQKLLFDQVSGTEGTAVHIGADATVHALEDHYWVDVAVANSMPQVALGNLCRLLYHHEFDVSRARLDVVPDGENGNVTILRTLISPTPNSTKVMDFDTLARKLKRAKWLDPETNKLVFDLHPWLGITRGEILTAFGSLLHPILAKVNPLAYSKANILERIAHDRFIGHAAAIADVFLERFKPTAPLGDTAMEERLSEIAAEIENDVEDTAATEILLRMMDIVRATLKTNIYMPERYALGLRLDPTIMGEQTELPYGVFFIHGRRFNGFHVRFRDISRGGLRLVTPANSELYALESARHYDECYGLAFAQQMKNKDIPEGGSKAVNLINTATLSDEGKAFVMRKSVKAFTDSILDLIVSTDETKANIIDRLERPEVLYLGPDEQVIPDDIMWIVKRAAERGYGTPAAFMSSKPRSGINHKEFGVTSEGVNVYLDTALRRVLGINPNEEDFTIKITGGPDGDVAGNEIKILVREYGEHVRIVGVADHSGCAEDPEGLSHEELMRLVKASLPIGKFDKSKLGPEGELHLVDTPEGVKARNTMHNRLEADAFVPCGGRPNTIDITNYKHFIKQDGTPSAPLIVEGANLFITAEARKALYEEAGVKIVKDSSANKGGVITSSFEICAAMMLSEDEFVSHKDQIVAEVLEKLRCLAKMEAELLFRECTNHGGALPDISALISDSINIATDALSEALDTLPEEELEDLMPLFRAHLPKTIADLAFDHVHERVPKQYIKNAIASSLAAKMVYKEGTKFISALSKESLAATALRYREKEKEVNVLMARLEEADIPEDEKAAIMKLLDAGGARAALGVY